jgi:CheY-like chemotaxis protein
MGNASLAAEELPPDNHARRLIEEVIGGGKRAADLTRQLLAYSGKGRFTLSKFNMSEAVSEMLELIHTSIPDTVKVELHLEHDLPAIEADPTQIQQIAMNLVINAAEAIEGNGVVRISTDRIRLEVEDLARTESLSHLTPGEYVLFQVEDSGVGMHEETRSRIFDPFFTTKFTGRGLGLSAVSGIVRGHRGAIQVISAPGQGSTFRVYLPVSHEPPEPWQTEDPLPPVQGSGTVLVADDDPVVRRVSEDALERRGYRVITAEHGREAVDLFQKHKGEIALVVLDLAMPVMAGEEAHEKIKAIQPDIPILISSGYSELIASSRFGPRGMGAFIQKPYTAGQFVDRVRKMLER